MNRHGFQPRGPVYVHALGLATVLVVEPLVGGRYLSIAQWLRDFHAWSPQQRATWQHERLRSVLAHAGARVPFYARLAGAGADSRTIRLHELPVVDKAQMRGDMRQFLSQGWERMPHVVKATGGTTGDPWRYVLDKDAWAHMYGAALYFRHEVGVSYGEPIVTVGSPPSLVPGAGSWKARVRSRLERRLVAAAGIDVGPAASLQRARTAGELGGAMWYGYAGTLAAMADAVLVAGLKVPAPRAIVSTSETLQPAWRRRIEEAFAAPLFDEYGCNDGGVLAQSCRRGRFHVADSLSLVEVLDGDRPCPPGVEGDVVVTNLHARVLPFLRYRIGDRATLGDGPCPCGRPGTTLESVAGRQGDRVRLPAGGELSALAFGHVFKQTPAVRRWQVVQEDLTNLTVRIDATAGFDEAQAALIHSYFRERCGSGVHVRITTSDPIERSPGGKHKVVVRQFEH